MRRGGLLAGAGRLAFLDAAVSRALRAEDPLDYLTWLMREGQHQHSPLFPGAIGSRERNRAVYQTGRAIWDQTPLPSHGLRPWPLPAPQPQDPCLCGSGLRFQRCCAGAALPPPALPILSEEIRYVALRRVRPEALEALPRAQLTPEARTLLAEIYLDSGQGQRTQELLLPLLLKTAETAETAEDAAAPVPNLIDEEGAQPALRVLLRCLGRGQTRLRSALLQRALASQVGGVRALALHRLAQDHMDQGRPEPAWAAFAHALREDPGHPDHGQVELALLVCEGHLEQARQRARYWLGRSQRESPSTGSLVPESRLRVFHDAQRDPLLGLLRVDAAERPEVGMLYRLLEEMSRRPAQLCYAVVPHGPGEARLEHLPDPEASATVKLSAPRATRSLRRLEAQWSHEWPGRRPQGIALRASTGPLLLRRGLAARWLSFLLGNARAFDDLQVLDDLCQAVLQLDDAGRVWVDRKLLEPILQRAETLAALALARLPHADDRLTPSAPHNALLLRLLTHLCLLRLRVGEQRAALSLLDLVLHHDRQDGYGLRPYFAARKVRIEHPAADQ